MAFFLQRICFRVGCAVDFKLLGLDFYGLPFSLAFNQYAIDMTCRAGGERFELLVGESVHVENNLYVANCAAVVQSHELHIFVASMGAYPSFHTNFLPG